MDRKWEKAHRFIVLLAVVLQAGGWCGTEPVLYQPDNTGSVFVPSPGSPTALNLDWADVPNATTYEVEVRREGSLPQKAVVSTSHIAFSPLVPGASGNPIRYYWKVVPYFDGIPGSPSSESRFDLEFGVPVSFDSEPQGLPAPATITADAVHPTVPYLSATGLFMRWASVPGAAGYEVQLVLEKNLRGEPIGQLHYRLRVGHPKALVTNISTIGAYRFDVRALDSMGQPGNPASGVFHLVESFLDVNQDQVLDGKDLFQLGSFWKQSAEGLGVSADVIRDGSVDQADLMALMIRLRNSTQNLPSTKQQTLGYQKGDSEHQKIYTGKRDVPLPHATKTSWLQGLANLLFGEPAMAGEIPKGATQELGTPFIIFPACGQSVPTTPFQIVWTEVPGATVYGVQLFLQLGGRNQRQPVLNEVGSEGDVGFVEDDVIGDGVVTAEVRLTFQNGIHTLRVQARAGEREGEFSRTRVFTVTSSPPPLPNFPFIDLDFNKNNLFDGADLLVFAGKWNSATGEAGSYDPKFDLYPPRDLNAQITPDGKVDVQDLLKYLALFKERCIRPKSPALDAPVQQRPLPGELFPTPQDNGFVIPFEWTPPPATEFSIPSIYEIEVLFPGSGSTSHFFTSRPFTSQPFLIGGTYSWRVRSIADDGTVGRWSGVRTFVVNTPTTGVARPTLISPTNGAVFHAGDLVRFVWSREAKVFPNVCRFDRLELYNGDVLSVSFDYYHVASKVNEPTVSFELPLYPNFGPDFRWRVVPFEELTDNIPQLLQFSGDSTGFREFRIERDPDQDPWVVSGFAGWKADQDNNGRFGLPDFSLLQRTWKSAYDKSRTYDINFDFDYSGKVDTKELLEVLNTARGNPVFLDNGLSAPIPIAPRSASEAVLVTNTGPGVQLVWFDLNPGIDRYLVEWIDNNRWFRGHYVNRLDAPDLLVPATNDTVVLNDENSFLQVVWENIPDAQEYDLILRNLESGFTFIQSEVPSSITDATLEAGVLASRLIRETTPTTPGLTRYSLQVFPKACAHYVQEVTTTEFNLLVAFNPAEKMKTVPGRPKQLDKVLNLPLQGDKTARIFARQNGLHHWRVTPVAADGSLGTPMRWQSFGAESRGPAFPEDRQ